MSSNDTAMECIWQLLKEEVAEISKNMDTMENRVRDISEKMSKVMEEMKKCNEIADDADNQLLLYIEVVEEKFGFPDGQLLKNHLFDENSPPNLA